MNIKKIALLVLGLCATNMVYAQKCLYVSSYHKGYAWSDGVERGLRQALAGKCEIKQFDMDTKRKKGKKNAVLAADHALKLIESWKPDVLITSDDNAARYLVMPKLKDAALPVVFCGVNWTVEEYGFPYSNVTGIVEVAPIKPMLDQAMEISKVNKGVLYLGASTPTEQKNAARFEKAMERYGFPLTVKLVDSTAAWMKAYNSAQKNADFIVVGSNSGISDWSDATIRKNILENTKKLSVTNHQWMMPYTILGYTKIPEEHGEWAGQAAVALLEGSSAKDIPIITNRKWDLWLNTSILDSSKIKLPRRVFYSAKKIRDDNAFSK